MITSSILKLIEFAKMFFSSLEKEGHNNRLTTRELKEMLAFILFLFINFNRLVWLLIIKYVLVNNSIVFLLIALILL